MRDLKEDVLHNQSLVGSVVIVVELSKEDYGSKGSWKLLDTRTDPQTRLNWFQQYYWVVKLVQSSHFKLKSIYSNNEYSSRKILWDT
jgi:hypothetical protein